MECGGAGKDSGKLIKVNGVVALTTAEGGLVVARGTGGTKLA